MLVVIFVIIMIVTIAATIVVEWFARKINKKADEIGKE